MHYSPPVDRPLAYSSVISILAANGGKDAEDKNLFDVTRGIIPSPLRVGDTVYSLRPQLFGTYYPGSGGGDGDFIVLELFPEFIGRGRSFHDAFLDWRNQVHCRFQELYSKRPFELTDSEAATWQLLERYINVNLYRTTTPLTIRQRGKVARVRPLPDLIEWEDGQKEKVRLDQMPGEFAAYKSGQPFEAIVTRDPLDFHLLKVTHVNRMKSLPRLSDNEFNDLIRSIPTTCSLPDTDWE